jgi:hypothetical protein
MDIGLLGTQTKDYKKALNHQRFFVYDDLFSSSFLHRAKYTSAIGFFGSVFIVVGGHVS